MWGLQLPFARIIGIAIPIFCIFAALFNLIIDVMLQIKYAFNRGLLTELSRNTADADNAGFWCKLQELSDRNPQTVINVTVRLKEWYGCLEEILEFDCGKTEIQNYAQALCDSEYKARPVVLLPGVDKKDVLQGL